ncbi:MAG: ABC transporter permease [Candidatus Tectomicrobia bacterium]|nr:ABC transporter permease [Candidatus Tectomicrobia bacterium]
MKTTEARTGARPAEARLPAGARSQLHAAYLRRLRRRNRAVLLTQAGIFVGFLIIWEVAARLGLINPFITSQPLKILRTFLDLLGDGSLYQHVWATLVETIVAFVIGTLLGLLTATVLWWSEFLARVFDPYIVVANSIPKIALGPVFIVWLGFGPAAILGVALTISVIVSILMIAAGFNEVSPEKIKLLRTFGASKWQVLQKVVLPGSMPAIIGALKTNIGLTWIGVIVGEFLVSKRGLGYLIIYGGHLFNLHLVMTSIAVLSVLATAMYLVVSLLERRLLVWKE